MRDISLDIESAGVTAGHAVVNIGAVYFDRRTGQLGERFDVSLDVQDLRSRGYLFNESTMEWWESQPEGVREHCWAGIVPVPDALAALAAFLEQGRREGDHKVWVKGEHMDIALLEFMYAAEHMPVPWHFRAPRDVRTYEQALEDMHRETEFRILREGKSHTGLGDAIYQARWICAAYKELNR